MIPDDVVAEVKRRADLGAVVGRTVKLKRQGKSLVGLCPFHKEKTPSFNVIPDEGFYYCFGCGAAGDVFSFLEAQTNQPFPDIVRALAAEVGIEVPERPVSPEEAERQKARKDAERVLDLTQVFFRQRLIAEDEGRPARAYLDESRKLDPEVKDRFGLGYGGARMNGLLDFLGRQGLGEEQGVKAGVLADGQRGRYDFFRGRITFPIRDPRGRLVGFAGRVFGPRAERAPKYVNTPQTVLYDKSSVLFGLYEALSGLKKGRPAVLVEGQLDVLATHVAGFPTGVAPCGTSLTPRHVEVLKRHTDQVVICLDADAAGQAATERAVLLCLMGGLEVGLAELVEGDPDDLVRSGGADVLKARLEGAKPALDVFIERAVERAAGSMTARIRALTELLPFLAAHRGDDVARRQYVKRVARAFAENEEILVQQIKDAGRRDLGQRVRRGSSSSSAAQPPAEERFEDGPLAAPQSDARVRKVFEAADGARTVRWSLDDRRLAEALLCHPHLAPRCGVIVPALKNPELRRFIEDLTEALVRFHDEEPRKVLNRISAPYAVARYLVEIAQQGGLTDPSRYLSESSAAQLIEGFLEELDKRPARDRLAELQRGIEAATERHDDEAAREMIKEQRPVVRTLSWKGAPKEPSRALPVAPPRPQLLEPPGFDIEDPRESDDDAGFNADRSDDGGLDDEGRGGSAAAPRRLRGRDPRPADDGEGEDGPAELPEEEDFIW